MKILAVVLLCLSISGLAIAGGDPVAGKATSIICIGCHGSDGNGTSGNPTYPKLAAQGEGYIIKQLTDFKTHARREQHMDSMVEAIDGKDIPNLAAYFSSLSRSAGASDKDKAKKGQTIFHNGIDARGVSACEGCHGADGKGNPAVNFPSLAGQHADYLIKILKDFRSGERHNDMGGMMRNIAKGLRDEEIEAVANYIASLN